MLNAHTCLPPSAFPACLHAGAAARHAGIRWPTPARGAAWRRGQVTHDLGCDAEAQCGCCLRQEHTVLSPAGHLDRLWWMTCAWPASSITAHACGGCLMVERLVTTVKQADSTVARTVQHFPKPPQMQRWICHRLRSTNEPAVPIISKRQRK